MNYKNLFKAIYDLTGIHLQEDKLYILENRLPDIMKKYSFSNYDQIAEKIQARDNLEFLKEFINIITTQETYFFRDHILYEAFVKQVVPEWLERNAGEKTVREQGKKLRIWSAGCATGQEPYSVALTIKEFLPHLADLVEIQASDISQTALEKARKGIYLEIEVERGIDERFRQKYFQKSQYGYELNAEIRNLVKFFPINLHIDVFPKDLDIIFCRNVAIYFTLEDRKKIYTRLRNSLKPDGLIFLGSAENLSGFIDNFIIREYKISRYYEFSTNVTFF
ncbi:MAG TPA: protein-glutamate O-methyltransferase CheR [Leptospiraceae bacterium]|nr:protein-glutamate O-methyltransferase CheR [Leptospiraceae bacterium]HMY66102.1 protein-glutamate O-methyltransferase CheR [Leptospiraceae bacterium]HMZ58352.1 protein-glutamate O-methyltransferase CheR [Leptospiraceae bacterium]HNF16551.1 protein-glutamate O-methyltransferase CheR [Leptospiraceae bacterium]HNI97781.1 protein-glutamate O-methyltransferase CheR [Leptospiraceae bacterium]